MRISRCYSRKTCVWCIPLVPADVILFVYYEQDDGSSYRYCERAVCAECASNFVVNANWRYFRHELVDHATRVALCI